MRLSVVKPNVGVPRSHTPSRSNLLSTSSSSTPTHPKLRAGLRLALNVPLQLRDALFHPEILARKREAAADPDAAADWMFEHMLSGAKDAEEAYLGGVHKHGELLPLSIVAERTKGLKRVGLYRCRVFRGLQPVGSYTGMTVAGLANAMLGDWQCKFGFPARQDDHNSHIKNGHDSALLYPALEGAKELPANLEDVEPSQTYYVFNVLLTLENGTDYSVMPDGKLVLHVRWQGRVLKTFKEVQGLIGLSECTFIGGE